MILIYVTLNSNEEARKIGKILLENKLTNCINFFPITCIYNYNNEVTEEPEVVLIIKTKDNYFEKVETVIKKNIGYENFIGQIKVEKINSEFENWLKKVVK